MELHDRLAALAHPQRLALLQLLLRRHPQPAAAGDLAAALDLKPNTLSNYLNALRGAGLISQSRRGTSLRYTVDLDGLQGLMGGIHAGCCNNRADLCGLPPPATRTKTGRVNVLFLCSANSARSLMAEALLRHHGGDRFNAYSAGLDPSHDPRAEALQLLASNGIDTAALTSKSRDLFTGEDAPHLDFVFTVCDQAANLDRPDWTGQPLSAHWGQPDPVQAHGSDAEKWKAYQNAFDALADRITAFVDLPLDRLDRAALQSHIDAIGLAMQP